MFDFRGFIGALMRKKSDSPVADLKSATVWVQELPRADIQEALEEILKTLADLRENKATNLKERVRILMYLDEKAITLQHNLCKDYLDTIDESAAEERLYLPTITGFWEEMSESYQLCLREFAQNPSSKKIWEQLPVITARALHYHAMEAKWCYMRYLCVEPQVWRNLNRLYLFADREGFAQTPIALYPGRRDTTVMAEYVRPHLLQLANPESLTPRQIELIDRWLDSWATHITVEADFRPHRQVYAVNLGDAKPARKLRRNMLGDKYRYWGVGMLEVAITKVQEQLRNGETPARLGLTEECRLPGCLDLIDLVALRWSGKGTSRKYERQTQVKVVQVVQGLPQIVRQMKPGNGATAPQHVPPAPGTPEHDIVNYRLSELGDASEDDLDNAEDGEPVAPTGANQWVMENESPNGFGAAFDGDGKVSLRIGTLLGMRPDDHRQLTVGVVRRISRDQSSRFHVGIETLSPTPILVQLQAEPANGGAHFTDAIYLPESELLRKTRSIILPTAAYRRGANMRLCAQGKEYVIRLQQILEQADDYTHIHFDVLAKYDAAPPGGASAS